MQNYPHIIPATLQWLGAKVQGKEEDFFRKNPGGYEVIARTLLGRDEVVADIRDILTEVIHGESVDTHLDVACGTGLVIDGIACATRRIGMDISQEALDFARETKDADIDFRYGDFHDLVGIQDGSVDVYTAAWADRFVQNRAQFLAEINRVLTPNGIALLHSPSRELRDIQSLRDNTTMNITTLHREYKRWFNRMLKPVTVLLSRRTLSHMQSEDGHSFTADQLEGQTAV